jgi:hypothetical protein
MISIDYLLGKNIKLLPEARGLLQHQEPYILNFDSSMLCDFEQVDLLEKRELLPNSTKLIKDSEAAEN